jgi:pSer/pThr/pTyr-binding forkhead associated (FHA) protein
MILNVTLITGEKLQYKIDKATAIVGRSGQCDAVIPHEAVSRKHCQIDYIDNELFVTDLGSINGVSIDGQKITPNKPVKFQSFLPLSFGAVQTLLVELEEERTSVQVNPLLTTTLNIKETKPKPQKIPTANTSPKTEPPKKKTDGKEAEVPMSNFIALCVIVVLGFAFFLFRENISAFFE